MKEYIEREAAKQKLAPAINDPEAVDFWEWQCSEIDSIPAADVRPVVRGKWIWDDEGYHCSECFFHTYGNTGEILSGAYRYCPNCGARMEGKDG